jgi:hypothetical protein
VRTHSLRTGFRAQLAISTSGCGLPPTTRPPGRIDILSGITGVTFDDAWPRRVVVRLADLDVPVLSKADFVRNKAATGRPKDLADMALLDEADAHGDDR